MVAAVRILNHRDGRSPTPEEVASLLDYSSEKVYVLVHELRALRILRGLETPFELRLDVGDPAPLESLPKGGGPSIEGELSEFQSREKEKQEEMERMFRGGEADRRRQERVSRLEQKFMKFKPKAGALEGLFKPGPESGGAEEEPEDDAGDAGPRSRPAPPPPKKPKGQGK